MVRWADFRDLCLWYAVVDSVFEKCLDGHLLTVCLAQIFGLKVNLVMRNIGWIFSYEMHNGLACLRPGRAMRVQKAKTNLHTCSKFILFNFFPWVLSCWNRYSFPQIGKQRHLSLWHVSEREDGACCVPCLCGCVYDRNVKFTVYTCSKTKTVFTVLNQMLEKVLKMDSSNTFTTFLMC